MIDRLFYVVVLIIYYLKEVDVKYKNIKLVKVSDSKVMLRDIN